MIHSGKVEVLPWHPFLTDLVSCPISIRYHLERKSNMSAHVIYQYITVTSLIII